MSRRPLIAGNWKMHLSLGEAAALARALAAGMTLDTTVTYDTLEGSFDVAGRGELQLGVGIPLPVRADRGEGEAGLQGSGGVARDP